MARQIIKRRRRRYLPPRRMQTVGVEPGLLSADPGAVPSRLELTAFSSDELVERPLEDPKEIEACRSRWPVVWINVVGLGDAATIEGVGQAFGLHRLALEDVCNVHQRPKIEEYGDHYYIVTRLLTHEQHLSSEQVSLFLGPGFVVTFQEREGDCFEPVRRRLRQNKPRIRLGHADYLAYALLDAVVDAYFPVLEHITERLEATESSVMEQTGTGVLHEIHDVRHDLMGLRRTIWPMREAIGALQRQEGTLIREETRVYLRDCYDHTVQLLDLVEMYRELAGSLMDAYLTQLSHRTGEVTKVLTIIATVFIPLTFIAGLYGMNFNRTVSPLNMPELDWALGYPAVLALMALVALGMLLFFYRRGWFGRR